MTTNQIQKLSDFINLESFERFKEYFSNEIGVLDIYSYYCLYLAVFHDTDSKNSKILSQNSRSVIDICDFNELIEKKMENIHSTTHADILNDFNIFCQFLTTEIVM